MMIITIVLAAISFFTVESRRYHAHDHVGIIANTVGPFNNPTETYPYYSLSFCSGTGKQKRHKQDLGETLSGSRKVATPYDLTFLDPVPWRSLCEDYLDPRDLQAFKDAIEADYFFEMLIDDLPMWGYLGEVVHEEFLLGKSIQGARVYLYPHLHFSIGFNGDQIVTANVTTDARRRVDITDTSTGQEVVFSYTVEWFHTPQVHYEDRMQRYADSTFLPTTFEIHWLSIINSFVLVLLLTAFLSIILMRILKQDFSKYMEIDEDELAEEETGWKMIHGDVFRVPQHLNLFAALIGAGAQLFFTVVFLLISVLVGAFKFTKRGALLTAGIMIFAVCGLFGGIVAGRLFKQLKGKNWAWNTILTATILPVPLGLVFMVVNTIAWSSSSTAALPVTTITLMLAIILFVHFPMTVLGAIVGRNQTEELKTPCRTNKVPREIPQVNVWYKHPAAQLFMAGFLPFSAIYIELHYIFASLWGHKIYTLFGILFMAFVMLTIVTSFITIALLYFQLAREDHHWWWSSFSNGGATGLFVFAYSFYYFWHRSNMNGVLQLSYYFGYMSVASFAFFLMLGFVGFYSSFEFVNYIYGAVKTD
jgi:transmembrane 9 superfamily protein 1